MLAMAAAGLLAAMGSCPDGSELFLNQAPEDPPFYMSACGNSESYTHLAVPNQPQTKEHLCRASTASTPCCGGMYKALDENGTAILIDEADVEGTEIYCLGGVLPAGFEGKEISLLYPPIMEGCGRGLRHIELPVDNVQDGKPGTVLMSTVDCGHSAGLSAGAVGGIVAGSVLGPFAVATAARALL